MEKDIFLFNQDEIKKNIFYKKVYFIKTIFLKYIVFNPSYHEITYSKKY